MILGAQLGRFVKISYGFIILVFFAVQIADQFIGPDITWTQLDRLMIVLAGLVPIRIKFPEYAIMYGFIAAIGVLNPV